MESKNSFNENLKKVIRQYLEIETNYALVINGKYGIGKTHYFKNILAPEITKLSPQEDASKKFVPIHISLFGISTIEQVQTQIFLSLYPILKNKNLKLATGAGKAIIRGLAHFGRLGDIDKYIKDINLTSDDWVNYDELVLCFDDLDRKSDSLSVKDIFGFINTIVENEGTKVLIIYNEEDLLKNEDYTSKIKEKVVGVSVEFNQDIESAFNEIITQRYSSPSKIYHQHLNKFKNEIIEVIKKNENNLRNLIFFLEHYRVIFNSLAILFEEDKDFSFQKEEKHFAVLYFSLAISIEYKKGSLNASNFEDIKDLKKQIFLADIDFSGSFNREPSNEEDTGQPYIEIFKEAYYSENRFHFFDSIFNYLTGQSSFNIDDLKLELENYFKVDNGKIPESELVLKELDYSNCLKLDDKQYRDLTNEMLRHSDKGKYILKQYPTIFHYATRFNNVLNYNVKNLKERLKKGILKGKGTYQYDAKLNFLLSVANSAEYGEDLKEVIRFCIQINEETLAEEKESILVETLNIFKTDFEKFISIVTEEGNQIQYTPFWLQLPFNQVYRRIVNLEKDEILMLGGYFKNRYRISIFEKLYPEKDFLIQLSSALNKPTQARKKKNLKNAILNILSNDIEECINNFPN